MRPTWLEHKCTDDYMMVPAASWQDGIIYIHIWTLIDIISVTTQIIQCHMANCLLPWKRFLPGQPVFCLAIYGAFIEPVDNIDWFWHGTTCSRENSVMMAGDHAIIVLKLSSVDMWETSSNIPGLSGTFFRFKRIASHYPGSGTIQVVGLSR